MFCHTQGAVPAVILPTSLLAASMQCTAAYMCKQSLGMVLSCRCCSASVRWSMAVCQAMYQSVSWLMVGLNVEYGMQQLQSYCRGLRLAIVLCCENFRACLHGGRIILAKTTALRSSLSWTGPSILSPAKFLLCKPAQCLRTRQQQGWVSRHARRGSTFEDSALELQPDIWQRVMRPALLCQPSAFCFSLDSIIGAIVLWYNCHHDAGARVVFECTGGPPGGGGGGGGRDELHQDICIRGRAF